MSPLRRAFDKALAAHGPRPGPQRHVHRDLVLLHWTMALLVVLTITGVLARGALPAGDPMRPLLRSMHILVGQVIFVLTIARVFVRLRHELVPVGRLSPSMRWTGRAVHVLLYVVLLAQPVIGVLSLQAGDKAVRFFGIELPRIVAAEPHLYFELKAWHQHIGDALYIAVLLHVVAALFHHYVLRDDSLGSMLRFERVRRRPDTLPAPGADTPVFTAEQRRRMTEAVRAGNTPAQVAARFGASAGQVTAWITEDAADAGARHDTPKAPQRAPAGEPR